MNEQKTSKKDEETQPITETNTNIAHKCECEHVWINDLIDIHPNFSLHITYCLLCELTK